MNSSARRTALNMPSASTSTLIRRNSSRSSLSHCTTLRFSIAAAKDLACLKDAAVIAYDRGDGYRGSIYAGVKIPSDINVKLQVPGLSSTPSAASGFRLSQPPEMSALSAPKYMYAPLETRFVP